MAERVVPAGTEGASVSHNPDEILTIKCWSNNQANIHSRRDDVVEVLRSEWEKMTEDERDRYVYRCLAENEHFSYDYEDPLKKD